MNDFLKCSDVQIRNLDVNSSLTVIEHVLLPHDSNIGKMVQDHGTGGPRLYFVSTMTSSNASVVVYISGFLTYR